MDKSKNMSFGKGLILRIDIAETALLSVTYSDNRLGLKKSVNCYEGLCKLETDFIWLKNQQYV